MKKLILLLSIFVLSTAVSFDASARYKGDLNGDDRVDLADMVYLAKAIKGGSTDRSLDVNASGKVDDNDLQKLADIIISGKLTEDSGMNVGIGGWEDNGEDYGGTVKAPAFNTRSADETRFYMRTPKSEGYGRYSMELGISEGNEALSAILFTIRLPRELRFDASETVELDPSVSATHRLYGTPKFVKENLDDEWNDDHVLRFIVMSADMDALSVSSGKMGNIIYSVGDCWGEPVFKNCQTAAAVSGDCTDIPEHGGNYSGNFKPIEVSSVWFEQSDMTLTEGDEWNLYANIDPWDATDQTLVWTSSDESVVTVFSEDGRNATVKAIKPGSATITVSSTNGKTATCEVTVAKRIIEVTSVTLDKTQHEITEGDTAILTATVNPNDATDKTLTWTSSDASVASVSSNGEVTAIQPGSATITVSSSNGKTATCSVTVAKRIIEVTGIVLSNTELKMTEGDTANLTASVQPADATDKTLTWTSSDPSVASVSANGEVKALKEGTATITVKAANGISATCKVTVESGIVAVTSVTLDMATLEMTEGDTETLPILPIRNLNGGSMTRLSRRLTKTVS